MSRTSSLAAALVAFALAFAPRPAAASTRLLTGAGGSATVTAGDDSYAHSMSDDGRYVVLVSKATDLVAGLTDANGASDVFLLDRNAGTVTLVSRATTGATTAANGASYNGRISGDGAYVAFGSEGTNLVAGVTDANAGADAFLYRVADGAVTLVSRSAADAAVTQNGFVDDIQISADGAWVAYRSTGTNIVAGQVDTNTATDVFLFDRVSNAHALVSHVEGSTTTTGNSTSFAPQISADGAYVAFASPATNLLAGQVDNNFTGSNGSGEDIWLYSRATGILQLASRAASGATATANGECQGLSLSGTGAYLAFGCAATNLVASQVDGNAGYDVFLFDQAAGTVTLVSRAATGGGATTGNGASFLDRITRDGAFVSFSSDATNLVAGVSDLNGSESDVFLFSRAGGSTALVSHAAGAPTITANGGSFADTTSADGSVVVLQSEATNLVDGQVDSGSSMDLFMWHAAANEHLLVTGVAGSQYTASNGDDDVWSVLSDDGANVVFTSSATDLVPGQVDGNNGALEGGRDVFLFSETAGSARAGGAPGVGLLALLALALGALRRRP